MNKRKSNILEPKTTQTATSSNVSVFVPDTMFLWLVFFANSLFVIPSCLDTSLVPRFFFLSASLLLTIVVGWKTISKNTDWRLNGFDLLFLGWFGINAASISWAFSWSEAIFFTQKVFLTLVTYWFFRQSLLRDEANVRKTMRLITQILTFIVSGIILVQLAQAYQKVGFDNDKLYDFAKGVYGNKGLATDFLFFLLVFNIFFFKEISQKWLSLVGIVILLGLILLLQTRTVYLAVLACALVYLLGKAWIDVRYRPILLKKVLPLLGGLIIFLVSFISINYPETSLTERLNPETYLTSASANERRFVWYKTDKLNEERPLLGVGNGSWKFWFPSKSIDGAFRLQEKGIVFTRAHNDYLEIRAEMGLVGVGVYISLFLLAFYSAIFGLIKMEDAQNRHDLLVLIAGLLGYCIIQYFDFPRERMEMQVILALFFAFIAHRKRGYWEGKFGINLQKLAPWTLIPVVLGLVFCLIIGWFRIIGEQHNVKLLEAQSKSNWNGMVKESLASRNMFYEYNDVVLPIVWYEGIGHFQQNNFPKAITSFKSAYDLNPFSFQVINNLASAMVKSGATQEAIKMYEKTLVINPRYDEGKFNLSFAHYELKNYQKALEYANSVDTIPNPKTDDDFKRNKAVLDKKASFINQIKLKLSDLSQSNQPVNQSTNQPN
jgi:O-antigen ligase